MAVSGMGTEWNLPNFSGELFTADAENTPLLSMIGGLTGGLVTDAPEFAVGQLFEHPEPTQPSISETASVTAPPPSMVDRRQLTNVTQIHQETVALTYRKMSSMGKMSGINVANQSANPPNEMIWQLQQKLVKVARDVEHSFINGVFQRSTNAGVAYRTRGMLELTQMDESTSIDADGAPLTKTMLNNLYREMFENGALFTNAVMFVNGSLKQQITEIYNLVVGFALPPTRNVGGLNIQEIEFDFGRLGIVTNRFMPTNSVLIADVGYMAPVFQEVPGKGILFTEPLEKTGAADREMLYAQIGLDTGVGFLHGSIRNILV